MSELDRKLAGLRELHRHSAALLTDPAVWTGIAAGLVLAVAFALLFGRSLLRRAALEREARAALARTRDLPSDERLAEQAKILRRLGRTVLGSSSATLRGDAWLAALDGLFRTDFFSKGAGRCFAADLYAAPSGASDASVTAQLEALVPRLRR